MSNGVILINGSTLEQEKRALVFLRGNEEDSIKKAMQEIGAFRVGRFLLSSGKQSPFYIQCALLFARPALSEFVCSMLVELIIKTLGTDPFDAVVSPALGGMLIGYEIASILGVPYVFCERKDGKLSLRRGFSLSQGSRMLIVDDVMTTSLSVSETDAVVQEEGAKTVAACVFVDRRAIDSNNLPFPVISLTKMNLPTYDEDNLPDDLSNIPLEKPGSRTYK